jgi:hypothetical protein
MCFHKEIANVEVFFLGLGKNIKGMYQTSLMKCLFGSPRHYLYSHSNRRGIYTHV